MVNLPGALVEWIKVNGAGEEGLVKSASLLPGTGNERRPFAIVSVPLSALNFMNHEFNPRSPSDGKVKEMAASIRQLGLLTPLTCCFLEGKGEVRLIDGRHRYSALNFIGDEDPEWKAKCNVELKIYFGLEISNIYILSTYLNRTRRNLKKGEYYQFVVKIYEEKDAEITARTGRKPSEADVFSEVSQRELAERNVDLSIGRLVGLAAFDEEEKGAWYPYVGNHQSQKVLSGEEDGYCPLTAGNLASLLKFLCKPAPYNDPGETRSVELNNVLLLGEIFTEEGILKPVSSLRAPTATTAACKHWPLVAFGNLLRDSNLFDYADSNVFPFAKDYGGKDGARWDQIRKVVRAYRQVMEEQALAQAEFTKNKSQSALDRAWSYQTQKNQILGPLLEELREELVNDLPNFDSAAAPRE